MARKTRVVFVCQQCGHAAPRWLGQCPGCGAWGSIDETKAFTLTTIPTPLTPTGTISDTTPTYTFTRIPGAIIPL